MQKHAVKKGAILLFLGTIGFILECISAMEYFQGKDKKLLLNFQKLAIEVPPDFLSQ